jgi:hypothetical protein
MILDIFLYGTVVSVIVGAALYFVTKLDAPG